MSGKEEKIWYEMARRKVAFHSEVEWNEIMLWGLFNWGDVSALIKAGKLITNMKKEHKVVWVTPSEEAWNNHIKPLLAFNSLEDLTHRAGWR